MSKLFCHKQKFVVERQLFIVADVRFYDITYTEECVDV